ncbi:hypothetical protein ACVIRO_003514 [Rhizobium ruizarguesonis]
MAIRSRGEQRELHARLSLGDAVAHRRHAASHLRHAACLGGCLTDDRRIGLEWLVSREHVVIGGDDAEIGDAVAGERILVGGGTDREAMGKIGASEH